MSYTFDNDAQAAVLPNGVRKRSASPRTAGLPSLGFYGQLPARRPRLFPEGEPQLRMPPFETLFGFPRESAALIGPHLDRIGRVARFIIDSWRGVNAIASVRITGYVNADEAQPDLGQRRADGVLRALLDAIGASNPTLLRRIQFRTEDRGFSPPARVEIYVWAGPSPAPPPPPLVRVPSPAEVARQVVPLRPETPEERIARILRTLPPAPPRGRSLSTTFWQGVDDALNRAMSRAGVPQSLRGHIRAGAHAAIERAAGEVLDRVLGASGLGSEVQEAIKGSVRAFLQVPIR
jgi:hypothetical protein